MASRKPRIQYFVMLHEGQWKVRRYGKLYGPYPTQEAAIRIATDVAQRSGKNDRPAQVMFQDQDGEFRAEWTFGLDFFPPTG